MHHFGHFITKWLKFSAKLNKYFANNSFMQISFMRSCYDSRQKYFP